VPPSDPSRPRAPLSDLADSVRPARIVVADDDRLGRELLAGILRGAGHTVDAVEDGQEAVDRVAQGGVDLVLLDSVMPRLSGLEACRLLKGMTLDTFLPVVLVTVRTDTQSRVEGLRIGADDYVGKPFEEAELLARVQSMLRIKRLHEHIVAQKARFERMSVHDELTGLYNFRFLHTRLNEEFKRAERYHEPFACVLIDIDQLRAVNEVGGRTAGDIAIRRVADGIRRCVREVDVVARYGGEEFLAVLPSTHFAGSVVVAERIWREISSRPIDVDGPRSLAALGTPDSDRRVSPSVRAPPLGLGDEGRRSELPGIGATRITEPGPAPYAAPPGWAEGPRQITVSIGVALYPSRDVRTKDALIRAAEAALNQAKREGGNRICVFQQQGYIYSPAIGAARPAGESPAIGGARPPTVGTDGPVSTRARLSADSWRPDPESEGGRKGS
jgi:two-component system cell cycle response regulator